MNKPGFQPSLKGRALRLLSQREHSRSELERKLAQHEEVPGELTKALDALQARDFINDERAIESVVKFHAYDGAAPKAQPAEAAHAWCAALRCLTRSDHTHTHTHAHAHMHTHTRARTHARTHPHART